MLSIKFSEAIVINIPLFRAYDQSNLELQKEQVFASCLIDFIYIDVTYIMCYDNDQTNWLVFLFLFCREGNACSSDIIGILFTFLLEKSPPKFELSVENELLFSNVNF